MRWLIVQSETKSDKHYRFHYSVQQGKQDD